MRIISGSLKGATIPSPPGNHTRPTTDAWRETIFSALSQRIEFTDKHILDICAGSGALGFEALSRGAGSVLFIEEHTATCKHLRTTAQALGVSEFVTIAKADALQFLGTQPANPAHCAFIDAPYHLKISNAIIYRLLEHTWLTRDAYVVCEHSDQEALMQYHQLASVWTRERGTTVVDLLNIIQP